jgi:hypothetical protein
MNSNETGVYPGRQEHEPPQSPEEAFFAQLSHLEQMRLICRNSGNPVLNALGAICDCYVPNNAGNAFEVLLDYVIEQGEHAVLDEGALKGLLDACCAKGTNTALLAKRLANEEGLKKTFEPSSYHTILSAIRAFRFSLENEYFARILRGRAQKPPADFFRDDLAFLYWLLGEPRWHSHQDQVRKLLLGRNVEKDMLAVFGCDENQIARSVDQITSETKAYVGKLEPGVFKRLPEDVEHVYTKFPEGRIRRHGIEIGGKDERVLGEFLKRNGCKRGVDVESMMEHDDFGRSLRVEDPEQPDWKKWSLKSREEVILIRLSVEDLGFSSGATLEEIYAKAKELGLELCPPEVGPQLRLQYLDQSTGDNTYVGMKPIPDGKGNPRLFSVVHNPIGEPWIDGCWMNPKNKWYPESKFVFRLRRPVRPEPVGRRQETPEA